MTTALVTGGLIANRDITLNFAYNINAELQNLEYINSDFTRLMIKSGNTTTLMIEVTSNGVRLTKTYLETATDIIFMVKKDRSNPNVNAVITKTLADGITILPDGDDFSPNLQIDLTATDTTLYSAPYPCALKIVFPTQEFECDLTLNENIFDEIFIQQDVIR